MKIFISWSGRQSREMALALREWLRLVLQYANPWLSDVDIAAGERWSLVVGKELEASSFGILCLTRENLRAPWVLFEAGALAKSLSTGLVCPYLLDIDFGDIGGPLAQFQAKKADEESTFELISAINSKYETPVEEQLVAQLFRALWPKLDTELSRIRSLSEEPPPRRPQEDVLEDVVSSIRSLDQRLDSIVDLQESRFAKTTEAISKKVDEGLARTSSTLESLREPQRSRQNEVLSTLRELRTSVRELQQSLTKPDEQDKQKDVLYTWTQDNSVDARMPPTPSVPSTAPPRAARVPTAAEVHAEPARQATKILWRHRLYMLASVSVPILTVVSFMLIFGLRDHEARTVEMPASATSSRPGGPEGLQKPAEELQPTALEASSDEEATPRIPEAIVDFVRNTPDFDRMNRVYGLSERSLAIILIRETSFEFVDSLRGSGADSVTNESPRDYERYHIYRSPLEPAIRRVQAKYDLTPDGITGPETAVLLLTLGLRWDARSVRSSLDGRRDFAVHGMNSYDLRTAWRICDRAPELAEAVLELLSFYPDEYELPECSLKADNHKLQRTAVAAAE